MIPPGPGHWSFAASLTSAKFNIEHIADDEPENPVPYWHIQSLLVSELGFTVSRGLWKGGAVDLDVPLRSVRSRVHYEDLDREPFVPNEPENHHRNETLIGIADPLVALHLAHEGETWIFSTRLGVSIPLGKTEPNPFELGREGLRHQHIQFGTGTFYPVLGASVGRPFGEYDVHLTGVARLPLSENENGYQAGQRYGALLSAGRGLWTKWQATTEFGYLHERAETWDGVVEEEGNLGRSDLLMSLGLGYELPAGILSFNVSFPLWSESTGEQVDIPLVLALSWEYSAVGAPAPPAEPAPR